MCNKLGKTVKVYSGAEILAEVQASMAMEGMELTDEDIAMLKRAQKASKEDRDQILKEIIALSTL